MDIDTAITLKGSRGQEVRNKIQNELGLSMDIMAEAESVKIRGTRESLDAGAALLEEFRDMNYVG